MKILIISNNVISDTSNMGKTFSAYFNSFDKNELAQFYISQEEPTNMNQCSSYYNVTDVEVLKSIFKFKTNSKVFKNTTSNITTKEELSNVYAIGRKHGPISSVCRDLVWKMGHWFNKKLKNWLNEFNPDCIFFASGNCCFMYDIAYKLSRYLNVPIVNSIYDDYYINNDNNSSLLGRFYHKKLVKKAKIIFNESLFSLVVCEEMMNDYTMFTDKPLKVMYTGSTIMDNVENEKQNIISYLGGVSLGRAEQISALGKVLKNNKNAKDIHYIDVYTAETDPQMLSCLTLENGVRLHKPVTSQQVDEILRKSLLSLHVESFNEPYKSRVKYSFSTKIPNVMSKSNCLLAFGPSDVASIGYLKRNKVGFVIDDFNHIEEQIALIINDDNLRNTINLRAKQIASLEHNQLKNSLQLKKWIETALAGGDINENPTN